MWGYVKFWHRILAEDLAWSVIDVGVIVGIGRGKSFFICTVIVSLYLLFALGIVRFVMSSLFSMSMVTAVEGKNDVMAPCIFVSLFVIEPVCVAYCAT